MELWERLIEHNIEARRRRLGFWEEGSEPPPYIYQLVGLGDCCKLPGVRGRHHNLAITYLFIRGLIGN